MTCFSQVFRLHIVMLDNLVPLHLAIGDLLRLLEVVVLLLLGEKALHLVVLQSERVASDLWEVVDEANHCLCAIGVELVVVSGFNLRPLIDTFLLGFGVRVLSDTVFDVVAEICDKTHTVFKLNIEGLIVNGSPFTVDSLGLTMTLIATLAQDGLSLVALDKVDFVSVMGCKLELMALIHQLNLVGHRMRTHLLGVEQVDVTFVGADMEIPDTVQFLADAVHRLVGRYKLVLLLAEGIDIRY